MSRQYALPASLLRLLSRRRRGRRMPLPSSSGPLRLPPPASVHLVAAISADPAPTPGMAESSLPRLRIFVTIPRGLPRSRLSCAIITTRRGNAPGETSVSLLHIICCCNPVRIVLLYLTNVFTTTCYTTHTPHRQLRPWKARASPPLHYVATYGTGRTD